MIEDRVGGQYRYGGAEGNARLDSGNWTARTSHTIEGLKGGQYYTVSVEACGGSTSAISMAVIPSDQTSLSV